MGFKESLISILPQSIQDWITQRGVKRLEASKDKILRQECMQTGRIAEYEKYKKNYEIIRQDILRYKEYIEKGVDLERWNYELSNAERELSFVRPNFQEDIDYRNYWGDSFATLLRNNAPAEIDLRFHGTPIYNAKEILKIGGIFPSVDLRDKFQRYDLSGQISVTSVETIDRTLQFFSDIAAFRRSLPCGCIFALLPRTQKDKELKDDYIMESVDFKSHPEQLYGIITTNENIPNVQKWLEEASLDKDLVTNFEGFLERMKSLTEKPRSFESGVIIKDPQILNNIKTVGQEAAMNINNTTNEAPTEDLSK